MAKDYIVRDRWDKENLSNLAGRIRREAKISDFWKFNIVNFILNTLPILTIGGNKYKIDINFLPEDAEDKACVKFKPKLSLFVKRSVWEDAKNWNKDAIFILAHELGHIFLHREIEKAFPVNPDTKFAYDREYSVEWQANRFAEFFVAPDNIVRQFSHANDPQKLSDECVIPLSLAQKRLTEFRESEARKARVQASIFQEQCFHQKLLCPDCGLQAIPEYPLDAVCEECGSASYNTHKEKHASYNLKGDDFLI